MADGFVLNIPPEMIQNLKNANEALNRISATSKRVQDNVNDAFQNLTNGQINQFLKKLGDVQVAMDKIGLDNVGKLDMGSLQRSLSPTTDAIVKMSEGMARMGETISANIALTKSLFNELSKVSKVKSKSKGKDDEPQVVVGKSKGFYTTDKPIEKWDFYSKKIDEVTQKITILNEKQKELSLLSRVAKTMNSPMSDEYQKQIEGVQKEIESTKTSLDYLQKKKTALAANGEEISKEISLRKMANDQSSKSEIGDMRRKANQEAFLQSLKDGTDELSKQAKAADALAKQKENSEKQLARERKAAQVEENKLARERKAALKENEKNIGYSDAMKYSQETKSIKDEIHAIKLLENAKKNLNKETTNYQGKLDNLNDEIKRHKNNIDEANGKVKKLAGSHRHLMDISGQLARKLALVFSVSQIQGYITKMIEVRGEFELQNRALEAIIQNKAEANKLWNQTVNLAVASPFRVKELITYTKQLAAYRVETNKLYDTTKMLADVSAGLGVDMNRLILAYGQVKAANYLRGTELRQFSEAGINILQELANQFSEVEGRAYSVGEVFEMVSKRMVSFEDVEKVFKRITSEGGIFYKMQEIQAETLQGQISNLKDSIDIMFNEIGEDYDKLLKKGVKFVKSFVDNFSIFTTYLTSAIVALGTYKVVALFASDATLDFAKRAAVVGRHFHGTISLTKLLTAALKNLSKSIKTAGLAMKAFAASNPVLLIGTIVAGTALVIKRHLNDIDEATLDVINAINARAVQVKRLSESYDELLDKQEKSIKLGKKEDFFDEKMANLQQMMDYAKQNAIEIPVKLQEVTKENIDETIQKAQELLRLSNAFAYTIGKHTATAREGLEFGGIIGQNYDTDLRQFNSTFNELLNSVDRMDDLMNELELNQGKLNQRAKYYYDLIKKLKSGNEKTDGIKIYDRLWKIAYAVKQIRGEYEGLRNVDFADAIIGNFEKLDKRYNEAYYEIKKITDKIKKEWGDLSKRTDEEKRIISFEIQADIQKGDYSEFVVQTLKRIYENQLGIVIPVSVEAKNEPEDFLKEWQKKYNEYIVDFDKAFVKAIPNSLQGSQSTRTSMVKDLKEVLTQYTDLIKAYEQGGKHIKGTQQEELDAAYKAKEQIQKAIEWLVGKEPDKNGGRGNNIIAQRINLIEELHKKYMELNKTFDETASKEKVIDGYTETFNELFAGTGITIDQIEFITEEDVVKALNKLDPFAQKFGKDLVNLLNRSISRHQVQIDTLFTKEQQKEMIDGIEEMFDLRGLSKELKDMGIPQELAKSLFNLDYIDLDDITNRINAIDVSKIGKDMLDKLKQFEEKISDMENKEYIERMKMYVKYLTKEQSEAIKIKAEELRKLRELEETDLSPEMKSSLRSNIISDYDKKFQKQQFEDFKNSNLYEMMFGDVEHLGTKAIETLIGELNRMKGSLGELDPSNMKVIVSQIDKLESIISERNPFKTLRAGFDELKGLKPEDLLQSDLANAEVNRESAEEEIEAIDIILLAKEKGKELDAQTLGINKENEVLLSKSAEELKGQRIELLKKVELEKKNASNAQADLEKYAKTRKAVEDVAEEWERIESIANKAYGSIKEIMTSMGVEADSIGLSLADSTMAMIELIGQAVMFGLQLKANAMAAKVLGLEINASMGVIGWIVIALQGIATLLTAIFSTKDKLLVKQIEKQKRIVDELSKSYEVLSQKMDETWDLWRLQEYYSQSKKVLEGEVEALEAAISAAEQRKGANKEGSEANEELKSLQEQLAETRQELDGLSDKIKYDFAQSLEDLKSVSQDWTEAWYEAFKETGDGLNGLKTKFDDLLLSIIKRQASMKITGLFMERWDKELDKYLNAKEGKFEMTPEQAEAYANMVKSELPALSEALERYFKAFGMTIDSTKGTLSDLQLGIQGITEDTAEVIAAYLNSIRFFVSQNDAKMDKLIELVGGDSSIENPMLQQLKLIASNTENINTLLESVTRGGHTKGGMGIKVFLD